MYDDTCICILLISICILYVYLNLFENTLKIYICLYVCKHSTYELNKVVMYENVIIIPSFELSHQRSFFAVDCG